MPDQRERIANIKAKYPLYRDYNFGEFMDSVAGSSNQVICNIGHSYFTSFRSLDLGRKCPTCEKIEKTMLENEEYEKIVSLTDSSGNKLNFIAQNDETWIMAPKDPRSPERTRKIHILCGIHGVVEVVISELLRKEMNDIGCKKCCRKGAAKRSHNIKIFIGKAIKIHKNSDGTPKYDYSESKYHGMEEDITIKCNIHGYFTQTASSHLNEKNGSGASGCPDCGWKRGADKNRHTIDGFISMSQSAHTNKDGSPKYNYEKSYVDQFTGKVNYTNVNEKVCIICPIHNEFWQNAYDHMSGRRGCTYCHESEGENTVWLYLESMKIIHKREHSLPGMIYKGPLRLDFYLTNFNAAIEFNGEQHYDVKYCMGGSGEFEENKIRDAIKYKYCEDNDIKLLIIKYDEDIHMKIDEFLPTLVSIE